MKSRLAGRPLRGFRAIRRRMRLWISHRRSKRQYVPVYTLWRSWCDEVTAGGKFLMAALIVTGVGTVTMQMPIYQVLCALVAMTVVNLVAGFASLPLVRVQGSLPERTIAGETVTSTLTVTNKSSWRPIFDVGLGLFDLPAGFEQTGRAAVLGMLGPGECGQLPLALTARRRGLYELPPVRPFTTFPFNLFRIGLPARGDRHSMLVLPFFHPLDSVTVPATMRYQPGGIALTSNVGESPEYIGNREYVSGEPIRRLDFRSWARLGRPVVREYQEEFYCRVALIVDTFVTPETSEPVGGYESLEAAISLTAAVADALSGGEYLIDIFAAGDELHVFRAGRHTAHLENILEILACVEASHKDAFVDISSGIAGELDNISTAICVLLAWDEQRRSLVRQIVESGCALKILLIHPDGADSGIDVDADVEFVTPQQVKTGGISSL